MSSSDRDQEFERALMASARADDPPPEGRAEVTDQAWSRFVARAALLGEAVHGEMPRNGRPASRRDLASGSPGGFRGMPMSTSVPWRWLLVGALAGSLVTGALLVRRPATKVVPQALGEAEREPVVGKPSPPAPEPVTPAPRMTESRAGRPEVRRHVQADRRVAVPGAPETAPSTLAAEVAALDKARAMAAGGRFQEAVGLIERYHYDYPMGELAADAEVIAIEALEAGHDRKEMTRRAWRFVQQHPDDPHVGRIKRLLVSASPP